MSIEHDFICDLFALTGKRVLLTGASSGLGQHFVGTLVRAGATVIMAARSRDKMEEVRLQLPAHSQKIEIETLDVRDREAIRVCVERVETRGPLDCLVNNAGIAIVKSPEDLNDDDWDAVYETNLRGAWTLTQELIKRRLADQRPCSIVNIASVLGIRAIGHVAPYSAAKAGMINLGRDICVDHAKNNIRVNALAPGYFATEMNDTWLESPAGERLRQRIPAKRFGKVEDLDGALLFLCADASRYMNGNVITIDGGHTASL